MADKVIYSESVTGHCSECAKPVVPQDMFYLEGSLIVARWSCGCVTYDESIIKTMDEALKILEVMGGLVPDVKEKV